jgi:indolepyruvate ferredoxin oxidoreductase
MLIRDDSTIARCQRELRDIPGLTVLIYDQTCAAEKRRRRKRGTVPRSRQARHHQRTRLRRLRRLRREVELRLGGSRSTPNSAASAQIDQSSCNKDFSCVNGFLPQSFVTVHGGEAEEDRADANRARRLAGPARAEDADDRRQAFRPSRHGRRRHRRRHHRRHSRHGRAIRIAKTPEDIHTVRLGVGDATVVLACDMLVMADGDCLSKVRQGETKIVLNMHKAQTGEFTKNTEWKIPTDKVVSSIADLCGKDNLSMTDATGLATTLLGDSIATNMFMLGYAWQKGYIPLTLESIFRAIELNGVAIKMNQQAFTWGRRAAWDAAKVIAVAEKTKVRDPNDTHRILSQTTEELIERRITSLTGYQSSFYAKKYKSLVDQVKATEEKLNGKAGPLTEAVAKYYYKLMAYKDEYEVARLYTDGQFLNQIKNTFDGDVRIRFNLAPPLLAKRDEQGHLKKSEFGAWILPLFGILAKLKFLRGTPLDIFGYTDERKMERQLVRDYKSTIEGLLPQISSANYETAVQIASIPEFIRGYGHVKEAHLEKAKKSEADLLEKFKNPAAEIKKAA